MKQTYTKVLAFIACLLSGMSAIAASYVVDGIYYNDFGVCDSVSVTTGDSLYKGDIVIPDSIVVDGKTLIVAEIGTKAFQKCTELTSVKISNNCVHIANYAFDGCSALTSAKLPQSTANPITLNSYAFRNCAALSEVNIPETCDKIGVSTFRGCSSIKSIAIPDSTIVYSNAFYDCTGLTNVTIGEGVTAAGWGLFYNCSSLTELTIPLSLLNSNVNNLCYGCTSLTTVNLPDEATVFNLGSAMFQNCTNLENINIPSKLTDIPSNCFQDCSKLNNIVLPDSLETIGSNAFRGCSSLTAINFPEKLTAIPDYAFRDCSSLTEITLPESITSIGSYAFYNCASLTTVNILGKATIGSDAFNFSSSITPTYITTLNAPNGLGTIGSWAFSGQKLMVADLTLSGESVGRSAFYDCAELSSVKVDVTGNVIQSAFSGCTKLDTIDVKCAQIEANAFYNCSAIVSATIDCDSILNANAFNKLSSKCKYLNINCPTIPGGLFVTSSTSYNSTLNELILGEKVTNINNNFSSCNDLYYIKIASPTPPANASFTAKQGLTTTRIILNGEWVDTYKQADGWKDFYYVIAKWDTAKATLIDGIYYNFTSENTAEVVAGENAYTGAITIPATVEYEGNTYNVTAIRSEAFRNSKITSISLPEGIERIGVGAFYGCSFKSITFPNSLTTLDACAFGTSDITSITWGTGLTALNGMTFWTAYSTTTRELTIPASITSLGYGDFGGWIGYEGGTVTMESATPPTTDTGVFDTPYSDFTSYSDYATLIIPAGSLEAYQSVTPWKYFGTINEKKVASETLFEYKGLWYEVIEGSENEVQLVADQYSGKTTVHANPKNGDKVYTVTRIAENAFAGTNVTIITLPSTITTIGENAFNVTDVSSFRLFCNATTPPTLESTSTFAFDNWNLWEINYNLYVPAGSEEAYAAADQWKEFTIKTDNTGIESIDADGNNVVVNGNEISVEGDANIAVYSINGQLIYAGENITVAVPAGVYIVKVNNSVTKVIVR